MAKLMNIRRADACADCSVAMDEGARAYWDSNARDREFIGRVTPSGAPRYVDFEGKSCRPSPRCLITSPKETLWT